MVTVLAAGIGVCLAAEMLTQTASNAQLPTNLARGQRTFLERCAMCHGDEGRGDGELAPALLKRASARVADLADPSVVGSLGRTRVRDVIAKGGAHTGRSNLMPAWGERLSHAEIEDVTSYVMQLSEMTPNPSAAALAAYLQAPAGAPRAGHEIFLHQCSACHGLGGHGDGPLAQSLEQKRGVRPRNLTDSTFAASRSDRELYAVISQGGAAVGKSFYMPHWGGYLTPAQIKDVISYVRAISHTASRH